MPGITGEKTSFLVSEDIEKASFALSLDYNTLIYLNIKPAEGYSGSFSVSVNGEATEATLRSDGRYRLTIPGISAHKLGDSFVVEITTEHGTSTITVSAMSYVYGSLANPSGTDPEKNCAAALYKYYAMADAYKKSNV